MVQFFYVFFLKSNLSQEFYTCELVCNFKWERQTFNASKKVSIYLTALEKEQHKNIYIYKYATLKKKKCNISCNHACRITC